MLNLLEEGFNLGLGVASAACGKVDELVKSTLDKVGVKVEDSTGLRQKLVEEGKAARERIASAAKSQSAKLGEYLPNAGKLDEILEKLAKLEADIAEIKAALNQ